MNLANDVDRGRTPNDNDKLKGSDDIINVFEGKCRQVSVQLKASRSEEHTSETPVTQ